MIGSIPSLQTSVIATVRRDTPDSGNKLNNNTAANDTSGGFKLPEDRKVEQSGFSYSDGTFEALQNAQAQRGESNNAGFTKQMANIFASASRAYEAASNYTSRPASGVSFAI